jgi:hypothetical protein
MFILKDQGSMEEVGQAVRSKLSWEALKKLIRTEQARQLQLNA